MLTLKHLGSWVSLMKMLNKGEIQSVSGGEIMLNAIAGYNQWSFAKITAYNTILALGYIAIFMGDDKRSAAVSVAGVVLFSSTVYGLGYTLGSLNAYFSENAPKSESQIDS
jgi:hypothetical protein